MAPQDLPWEEPTFQERLRRRKMEDQWGIRGTHVHKDIMDLDAEIGAEDPVELEPHQYPPGHEKYWPITDQQLKERGRALDEKWEEQKWKERRQRERAQALERGETLEFDKGFNIEDPRKKIVDIFYFE